jgi:hypothetical protein
LVEVTYTKTTVLNLYLPTEKLYVEFALGRVREKGGREEGPKAPGLGRVREKGGRGEGGRREK